MDSVHIGRIRAVAAYLWQTRQPFDIHCCHICILGHALRMPEMKFAGICNHSTSELPRAWFGLSPKYFALPDWREPRDEEWFPYDGIECDAKRAAIMLLTAIGDMGPPERAREARLMPVVRETVPA